jgi:multiple sugar transport system substrate-binding protein
MKRGLFIASALAVIALTFSSVYAQGITSHSAAKAGCSAKGHISYWFWGDKGENIEQQAAIKAAEKACPGLKVQGIWKQGDYDTALATAIGSGNAPDVFQLDAGKRVPEFVAQHALANLQSYASKDHFNPRKVYWIQCAKQAYYKGGLYGLVRDCGNNSLLLYNKNMFKARHVAYPNNNWTLNNLKAAAVKLTGNYAVPGQGSQLRFGIPIQQDEYRVNGYMFPFGGNWLHANGSCGLNDKGSRAGLTWWRNLVYKYHGAPTPSQQNTLGGDFGGTQNQRFAMYFVGPWILNYMVKPSAYTGNKPVPWKWGLAFPPSNPANPKVHNGGVVDPAIEAVSSRSKNKAAAFEFIRYLTTSKPAALEAAFGIGIPGAYSLAGSKGLQKEYAPNTNTVLRANSIGEPLRTVPKHEQWVNNAYSPAMSHLFDGSWSVNKATSSACNAGKPYLP